MVELFIRQPLKTKMKKIFLIPTLLFAVVLSPLSAMADEAPGFSYVKVDTVNLDQTAVNEGQQMNVLDGHLIASLTAKQLTGPAIIEYMQLDIPADSFMAVPTGFKLVAPVIEYKIRNAKLKYKQEIKLTIPFESGIKFGKFAYYWSFKKQMWREVESVTDLEAKTVTLTMSLNNTRIMVVDTDAMVQGHASWYRYKGCMCAASPDYPKGTKLLVTNLNKNDSIVIKVNDWGPERDLFPSRVIDLDLVAFKKLGSKGAGVLKNIRVVPFHPEGFDQATVDSLLKGKVVKIDEALIAPYIPSVSTNIASQ